MKKIATLVVATLALAGCETLAQIDASVARAQCAAIGYEDGTEEMRSCMTEMIAASNSAPVVYNSTYTQPAVQPIQPLQIQPYQPPTPPWAY